MKCSSCHQPAVANHPQVPLCAPCLEAWRELEDFARPYQVPYFSEEDRRLRVDVVFAEFDAELRKRAPDLARRIRLALASGDEGLERLAETLTPEESAIGFSAMLTALASAGFPGFPGVPA